MNKLCRKAGLAMFYMVLVSVHPTRLNDRFSKYNAGLILPVSGGISHA